MCRLRFLLWQHYWRTQQNCDFLRSDSRNIRTNSHFSKMSIFPLRSPFNNKNAALTTLLKSFCRMTASATLEVRKKLQKRTFFKKLFPREKIHWLSRMHLQQPCSKFFCHTPKIDLLMIWQKMLSYELLCKMSFCLKRSTRHNYWNNFKKKVFSTKKFSSVSRLQVWRTCTKNSPNVRNQFSQGPK